MFSFNKLTGLALALCAAAGLGVCQAGPSKVVDGHTDQPVWPAVEKAHPLVESTVYADPAAFAKIVPGTPKLEVYRLLGHPMYSEGLAGVHEWNYVFKFPVANAGQFVTCQYKVLFDKDKLAHETYWNPAQCAQVVSPTPVAAVPPVVQQAPLAPHVAATADIASDVLFDFNSATLTADAPAAIDSQLEQMIKRVQNVDSVRVIGFTDRLGADTVNQRLSLRRAEAVKQYLVANGLPADAVYTQGRGAREPVVECPGAKSPSTIACLKPNRRVRLEVIAR